AYAIGSAEAAHAPPSGSALPGTWEDSPPWRAEGALTRPAKPASWSVALGPALRQAASASPWSLFSSWRASQAIAAVEAEDAFLGKLCQGRLHLMRGELEEAERVWAALSSESNRLEVFIELWSLHDAQLAHKKAVLSARRALDLCGDTERELQVSLRPEVLLHKKAWGGSSGEALECRTVVQLLLAKSLRRCGLYEDAWQLLLAASREAVAWNAEEASTQGAYGAFLYQGLKLCVAAAEDLNRIEDDAMQWVQRGATVLGGLESRALKLRAASTAPKRSDLAKDWQRQAFWYRRLCSVSDPAEYDVFTALQMTQSALDEQMVVSVALANSGRANASRHDDDKDISEDEEAEDAHPLEDEEPEESTDPTKVAVAEDDFGDAEDEDDLHLEVPPPDGHEELQIEENSSLAKNGRYRSPAERIHSLIAKFVYARPPARNDKISKKKPLLFMHQAKSGGTSLREVLYQTSRHHGLSAFIPCNGGVHCQKFDINGETAAVYGGHFCWKATTNNLYRHGVRQFSCVTIFREPVARYYYRLVGQLGKAPSCISDVPPQKLKSKLIDDTAVSVWDIDVEPVQDRRLQCGDEPESYKAGDTFGRVDLLAFRAVRVKVAGHLFPQFSDAFHQMRQVKLNKNKKYDHHCKITQAHIRAVKEAASHEIKMYKAAKKRVWRLKEELKL
ncbi:unnamed protein product, partial [Symbiodinium sp. KB8]